MKLIVKIDKQMKNYLGQYGTQVQSLYKEFTVLEIDEKYLDWLSSVTEEIEINATFRLKNLVGIPELDLLEQNDIILAILASKQESSVFTHYYNISTQTLKNTDENARTASLYPKTKDWRILCFSENNEIDTLAFMKCIHFLTFLSKEICKPLIIYANIEMSNCNNSIKNLSSQIINRSLEASESLLIMNSIKEKIYDHSKYIIKDIGEINGSIRRAISILKAQPFKMVNKNNRQAKPLYNDFFYLTIEPDEEIYLPLVAEASIDATQFAEIGLEYIHVADGLMFLYGRRSAFDQNSEFLRRLVPADYRLTILTHAPCMPDTENPMIPYHLPAETQSYTGRGVYIGIITTDDIDYTNMALRRLDGTTRIAYMWEQIKTDQGNTYTSEQINAALTSPNPNELIRLPVGESMSTVMAAISGGFNETIGYRGIAPEAEFLIAKIRPVSEKLQLIYGGMPSDKAIILHDALIGMANLSAYSIEHDKPLVLIMPFNGNIDGHDAALFIQQHVSFIAKRVAHTLIVPTGDEADKQHHFDILGEQYGTRRINIRVEQPGQNVVGVIYQWGNNMLTADLYPPADQPGGAVNLKEPGIYQISNTTIYSSGEGISFLNGALRILFRLENPSVGQWYIASDINMGGLNRIEMWISQEELNRHVKLNPHATLLTMGSTSIIPNIMSVGAYNVNTNTVIVSSGRGDSSLNIVPTLVTYGKSILAPCTLNEWIGVTGTVPAASIMAGAAATIYQKYMDLDTTPLPNTIVINSIIANALSRFDTLSYPNPSQGYGIFRLETLLQLLASIK
ncbi:S8 family serine peptidase [Cellulosilyticum sp. I15G10I2]|uniref:S8 family serine peptidase n=1 Tax=Cellulosilyticum sp. I15G10I2 TaxID=1892843 RepID=UPI00085BBA07|nr:S8 family serine peptidase [Cellulosilyticum sp. I15G10I2]